jgi:hypothetical protein
MQFPCFLVKGVRNRTILNVQCEKHKRFLNREKLKRYQKLSLESSLFYISYDDIVDGFKGHKFYVSVVSAVFFLYKT